MQRRITIRSVAVIIAAFVFVAFFYAYAHVRQFLAQGGAKLASGDQCSPETGVRTVQKQNPNKMLFIGCGGFLD